MNKNNFNERIILWTRQHKNSLEDLNKHGVYRVKKEYIIQKLDSISEYYFNIYNWYVKGAEKIVKRPKGVEYPIWLSTSSNLMLQPTDDSVVLKVEVDRKLVVITDFEKWGYVVNYWYIPLNKEDEKKHNEELKKRGIGNESSLCSSDKGNFYPLLKKKIIKSWDRLFDDRIRMSDVNQATLWEIKKEWVKEVIK